MRESMMGAYGRWAADLVGDDLPPVLKGELADPANDDHERSRGAASSSVLGSLLGFLKN